MEKFTFFAKCALAYICEQDGKGMELDTPEDFLVGQTDCYHTRAGTARSAGYFKRKKNIKK